VTIKALGTCSVSWCFQFSGRVRPRLVCMRWAWDEYFIPSCDFSFAFRPFLFPSAS